MNNYQCQVLTSNPGIQRDGTVYASASFIDGQWARFYLGVPRKIGGYEAIDYGTEEIIRNIYLAPYNNTIQIYIGRQDSFSYISLPLNGATNIEAVAEITRTPAGLTANVNNTWSMELYTSTNDLYPNEQIIAQVCPNGLSLNNSTTGPIYYGSIANSNSLTPIVDANLGPITCSGGVVFIAPFLVAFGNNGAIIRNDPNATDSLNTWSDETGAPYSNTIANTKIIAGKTVIGSGNPTGIFWSLNSLTRITWTGTTIDGVTVYDFANTPIQEGTSIISANCVINIQQTYYWIGNDEQFWMYDGVVQILPNTFNRRWFFDNLNKAYSTRIFGYYDSSYNELKWYAPFGEATENTHFIAYSIDGQYWYDSANGRSCGVAAGIYSKPILADAQPTIINTRRGPQPYYLLWKHETGVDKVIGTEINAIPANFTHRIFDICSQPGNENRLLRNRRVEVDINTTSPMSLSVINLMWAADWYNGNAITDGPFLFDRSTQFIDMASQGRLVTFKFESNSIGGDFQGGKTLYDWEIGDVNP